MAYVALTGNPNCGKTTLFNALTGLRAKVGNYAGVTVERKEGRLLGTTAKAPVMILDLPGTYSLSPQSLDEQISRDVLFHRLPEVPAPRLVVVVVDASNLERNLYYATQVLDLGYPTLIALNMIDVAASQGQQIDAGKLAAALGVPVFPIIASTGQGVPALRDHIVPMLRETAQAAPGGSFCEWPGAWAEEINGLADLLTKSARSRHTSARSEALLILSDERVLLNGRYYAEEIRQAAWPRGNGSKRRDTIGAAGRSKPATRASPPSNRKS